MIMDNNLFAAPDEWQKSVFSWFIENKIKMMSPQGWDARLLTAERAALLKSIKHEGVIHFAWDHVKDEKKIFAAIKLLKDAGFDLKHNISFYVLCGYDSTFEDDVYRCQKLKDAGVQAYAMRYEQTNPGPGKRRSKKLNALARWTARPELFWSHNFTEHTRKKGPGLS